MFKKGRFEILTAKHFGGILVLVDVDYLIGVPYRGLKWPGVALIRVGGDLNFRYEDQGGCRFLPDSQISVATGAPSSFTKLATQRLRHLLRGGFYNFRKERPPPSSTIYVPIFLYIFFFNLDARGILRPNPRTKCSGMAGPKKATQAATGGDRRCKTCALIHITLLTLVSSRPTNRCRKPASYYSSTFT